VGRVLGQNVSGQNGIMDKMVLDKMARTKWYRQNGTDKTLQIKSSINKSHPTDKNDFFR